MTNTRPPKLLRRQEKMASMMRQMIGHMERSIQTGQPCFYSPEMRSLMLHFEADRVRVEQFVSEGRDRSKLLHDTIGAAIQKTGTAFEDKSTADLMDFAETILTEAGVLS